MWSLYDQATRYHQLPSQLLRVRDPLAAWMFDNCVTLFGTIMENARNERFDIDVAGQKISTQKYRWPELMDETFLLPRPEDDFGEFREAQIEGIVFDEVR